MAHIRTYFVCILCTCVRMYCMLMLQVPTSRLDPIAHFSVEPPVHPITILPLVLCILQAVTECVLALCTARTKHLIRMYVQLCTQTQIETPCNNELTLLAAHGQGRSIWGIAPSLNQAKCKVAVNLRCT